MGDLSLWVAAEGRSISFIMIYFQISEDHQYACWNAGGQVNLQTGILAGKLALNRLHQQLAAEGFTQVSPVTHTHIHTA